MAEPLRLGPVLRPATPNGQCPAQREFSGPPTGSAPGYGRRMARVIDDDATARLKALADAEVAAAKQRHKTRSTATARFAAAVAKLADAETAWTAAQGEATEAKATAVADLLDSGMKPGEVAELLGIDTKEVRAFKTAAPATDTTGPGASANGTDPQTPAER